ncbi:hypothetical protein GGF32_008311 [Allomyces javanicus]|nr:hypothetical protein GGF32_008311 [Allomyces javanicus]
MSSSSTPPAPARRAVTCGLSPSPLQPTTPGYAVRHAVFVAEQGKPLNVEFDAVDQLSTTLHYYAVDAVTNEPLAACRVFPIDKVAECGRPGTVARLGRMGCVEAARGQGCAKTLCQYVHDDLRQRGFVAVMIHARLHKEGFYTKLGYKRTSDRIFVEVGMDHVEMELAL